ncbi:MAG: hypothetical protein KKA10_17810 [Euryarchaeota archaeon]|nr:hypothetical protein [Euryarchaeota archaeon]MCG2734834.1 hypothetical protein [Candidatus Methanoperedenaceae archaeon]
MNNDINLDFENVYEFIFDYVYSKFDMFGHLSPMKIEDGNWWKNHKYGRNHKYGGSWGPFMQWAFIKKGFDRGYAIREHHNQPHLNDIARDFDNFKGADGLPYGSKNKFLAFNRIDVCWGENENSFVKNAEDMILALEYEEMDKVKAFGKDLDSLLAVNSKLRVIIVRLFFPDNSDGMQLHKLEQILHEKCQGKSFGFIFIYPFDTTRIIFEAYEWAQNELKQLERKSFKIETNEEYVVKKLN